MLGLALMYLGVLFIATALCGGLGFAGAILLILGFELTMGR